MFTLFAPSPLSSASNDEEDENDMLMIMYCIVSDPHGSQMTNKNRCKCYPVKVCHYRITFVPTEALELWCFKPGF